MDPSTTQAIWDRCGATPARIGTGHLKENRLRPFADAERADEAHEHSHKRHDRSESFSPPVRPVVVTAVRIT
jgi:hypothetical protein